MTTRFFEMRSAKLSAAMVAALVISLMLVFGLGRIALAATDYDGDGVTGTADCEPFDAAVAPGKADKPDLAFEDTNCDGIDGDKSKAIFVSRTTGNDAGSGTKESPLQTIGAAISMASSDVSNTKDVYITGGTYQIANGYVNLVDNVGLYGGYTPSFDSRSASEVALIKGSPQAVLADGDEGVVLQQLTLQGVKVPNSSFDLSVYGVRAINGSKLALERVSIIAENGFDGPPGTSGLTPERAASGLAGSDAPNCDTPGGMVPNAGGGSFASNRGGYGGAGGEETNNGQPGSGGERGQGGSLSNGGAGGTPSNLEPPPASAYGQPGTAGATGSLGTDGNNANYTNTSGGITWRTDRGTSGRQGGSGQGGGGGGGGAGHVGNFVFGFPTSWAAGAGGGGGGQGGSGGGGGGGGTNGGGSFGVYLNNSSLATDASTTIQAGNGGNGGNGGPGGFGGQGGSGGPGGRARTDCGVTGLNGGSGGPGGQGGRGGSGGGGAGGPSAGIYVGGTTSSFARHNNAIEDIQAGQAGVGGRIGGTGTQAESGEAAPMLPAGAAPSTTSDFDGDGVADVTDACLSTPLASSPDTNNDGCPDRPPADTRAPDAPVINGPTGLYDTDGAITLSGTAEESTPKGGKVTVRIFDGTTFKGTTDVDTSGAWSKTLTGVANGRHTYTAKAIDSAGNISDRSNARTVIVDTVKPTVKSVAPGANKAGVARGTNVTATFGEKMKAATITKKTFQLYKVNPNKTTTRITNVEVSLTTNGLKATLDPFGPDSTTKLAKSTKYKAVVTIGAKDLAGNPLARSKVWFFTTGSS